MQKPLLLFLSFLLLSLSYSCTSSKKTKQVISTPISTNQIQWIPIQQLDQKMQETPKKVFIKVTADWCMPCKQMDKTTMVDPEIIRYLNTHYYAISLDFENKESVKFNGKTYKYITNGNKGYHELPVSLLNGDVRLPSLVFLDESSNMIQGIPGYQDAKSLHMILNYFGENAHQKMPWQAFAQSYKSPIQ